VPDAGRRQRAVRAGGFLEVREIPDRANVLEPVVLEKRDARRVVAAELEALETRDQQVFGGATTDVPDDSAHRWLAPL
jgi:hypothetical protein